MSKAKQKTEPKDEPKVKPKAELKATELSKNHYYQIFRHPTYSSSPPARRENYGHAQLIFLHRSWEKINGNDLLSSFQERFQFSD